MLNEIIHTLVSQITTYVENYGLLAVFILMTLESALIPIPSEVTMPFAGFMSSRGLIGFWEIVTMGAVGNLVGSLIAYWIGFKKGEEWVSMAIKRWGRWILLKQDDFDKGKKWFEKYGLTIAFTSRLLPIVRTFISLPAGIAKTEIYKFSLYTLLGSFIWSAFLTWLGLKLGQNWQAIEPYFRKFQFLIAFLGVVGVVLYIKAHTKHKDTAKVN